METSQLKFRVWTGKTMMRPKDIITIQEEQISGVAIGQMKQWKYLLFSGLTDKNGAEIYQGDVIAVYPTQFVEEFGKESRFLVYVDNAAWGFDFSWEHIRGSGYECSTHIMRDHEDHEGCNYEVIGNMFQNPDLITPTR